MLPLTMSIDGSGNISGSGSDAFGAFTYSGAFGSTTSTSSGCVCYDYTMIKNYGGSTTNYDGCLDGCSNTMAGTWVIPGTASDTYAINLLQANSDAPSVGPTVTPTVQPTITPTKFPTSTPTGSPTSQPSRQPSSRPSSQPTGVPSGLPTSQPSSVPSSQPSSMPSAQPSSAPSRLSLKRKYKIKRSDHRGV
jgi:hypothetical protein